MFPTTPRYTQSGGAERSFSPKLTPQHPVVASASRPPPGRRPGAASASTLRTLVAPQRIAPSPRRHRRCRRRRFTLTTASSYLHIASHLRLRLSGRPFIYTGRVAPNGASFSRVCVGGHLLAQFWVYLLFPALMNRPKPPPSTTPSTAATTTLHQFSAQ